MTYAKTVNTPAENLDEATAIKQVLAGIPSSSGIRGLAVVPGTSGSQAVVSLDQHADTVEASWVASLATGALAELLRKDQSTANEVLSDAVALGRSSEGKATRVHIGIGSVRLGQTFDSPPMKP